MATQFDDEVDVGCLLEFAKAYSNLGSAVQQLHELIDWGGGNNPPQLNRNAVRMIKKNMGRMHSMIAEMCDAWENSVDEE